MDNNFKSWMIRNYVSHEQYIYYSVMDKSLEKKKKHQKKTLDKKKTLYVDVSTRTPVWTVRNTISSTHVYIRVFFRTRYFVLFFRRNRKVRPCSNRDWELMCNIIRQTNIQTELSLRRSTQMRQVRNEIHVQQQLLTQKDDN